MDSEGKNMTMTEGQRQVWAARFERVQHDHMAGLMEAWARDRRSGDPTRIPREDGERMFREAISVAVQQANSAVLAMSVLPPPPGQEGAMLREMLGIPEPLRLALPEDMPEPMDYSLPPPGWMFPEGCTDVVHHLPVHTAMLADSPRVDRDAMEVTYPGWGALSLVPLAQGWREYMEATDPPGYSVVGMGPALISGDFRDGWSVSVVGQRVASLADQQEARALAWRCLERPHLVNLYIRLGKYLDKSLPEILGWTDEQYEAALAYIQASSQWEAQRPEPPDFLAT